VIPLRKREPNRSKRNPVPTMSSWKELRVADTIYEEEYEHSSSSPSLSLSDLSSPPTPLRSRVESWYNIFFYTYFFIQCYFYFLSVKRTSIYIYLCMKVLLFVVINKYKINIIGHWRQGEKRMS
jgi:hypothetical protein